MMVAFVGNTESRDVTTSRDPSHVPQMIKAIGGSSHRTAIHMGKKGSTGGKRGLGVTELLVERRTRQVHCMKPEVESMKSTGARVKSIKVSIKEGHI
jgi:hypothetical protein